MSDKQELTDRLNKVFEDWTVLRPANPAESMSNGTVRGLRIEILSVLGLPIEL